MCLVVQTRSVVKSSPESCAVLGVISVIYFAPIATARNMMLLLTSLRGSLGKKIDMAAASGLFLRRHKLQACRYPLALFPCIRWPAATPCAYPLYPLL